MNVLSLFNGMSFGKMALESLEIKVDKYYSSEIDKYANQATEALYNKPLNFMNWGLKFHKEDFTDDCGVLPTGELEWQYEDEYDVYLIKLLENKPIIQLGDVTKWREWDIDWASIDLVTGGFPCQAWSMAGKQLGDKDERGMLFWTMLDIIKHVRHFNPDADFLIENVKMKKEFEEYITTHTENALGDVYKVLINSALVSAQNRNRYYWTSFPVGQPKDKGIMLKDIIEYGACDATIMTDKFSSRQKGRKCLVSEPKDKGVNLSANEYVKNGRQGDYIKCNSLGEQEIFNLADNKRVAGVTENERGFRPHKGDASKSGISELGRILKSSASKSDTVTSSHMPKVVVTSTGRDKDGTLTTVQKDNLVVKSNYIQMDKYGNCYNSQDQRAFFLDRKHGTLAASSTASKTGIVLNENVNNLQYRKLTPRECFRLQTVPEHHIETLLNAGISNTQLYKMCGNGWTLEVIAHIFKGLLKS